MSPLVPRVRVWFCAVAFTLLLPSLLRANSSPSPSEPPVSARELRQGYRDGFVLARPRAGLRALATDSETRAGRRAARIFDRFGGLRLLQNTSGETTAAAIARLRATGLYDYVEPDRIRIATATPNDTSFAQQWSLRNTGAGGGTVGADIDAVAAWDLIHDAPNVIVAVIDTGVRLTHSDIAANLWNNPSPTFGDYHGARYIRGVKSGNPNDDSTSGHGSHVAGIIGAVANNANGIAGVAWNVRIMALKFMDSTGQGYVSDEISCIDYAIAHGAQIINASFGEDTTTSFSQSELDAIARARDAGIIFVAAAGNDASNMDLTRHYPASFPLDNIIAVGSSTKLDDVSTFSNYGPGAVELFAPGEAILSLSNAADSGTAAYQILSGTSMAAPHVSGALALLKAKFPSDNYHQLINRLLRGVEPVARFTGKTLTGGRLNLAAALVTTANRPFNDDFASRARLSGDNIAARGSTVGATTESGEPAHAGNGSASLWYEWTPTTGGLVRLSTAGSTFDTVLAVYTGTNLGALLPLASNDNDSGTLTSRLDLVVQAGTTYEIAVAGKNGATGFAQLSLGTVPGNDAFASPLVLNGASVRVTATNANCTREVGEPQILSQAGGHSLWYQWTAPATARVQVAAYSTDLDPLLAIYTGSSLTALTLVAASDDTNGQPASLCTLNAVAGVTYRIAVDSKAADVVGQFTLTLVDSLWQATTGNNLTSSPAVAPDGSVYVGSVDGYLYAYNADGSQKWAPFNTGGLIDTCSPAIGDDGTVYVGSFSGSLYAIDGATGAQKWTQQVASGGTVANSPALAPDGSIYLRSNDGQLVAFTNAGTQKWTFPIPGESYASPIVAPDGTIYLGADNATFYAVNSTGTQQWKYTLSDANTAIYTTAALDSSGNIYFATFGGAPNTVRSLTPAGALRWSASLGDNSTSSPALSADGATLYLAAYDHYLYAFNTANGALRWKFLLGGEVRASSPAVDANGVVYIGCYDGLLYAINPDGSLHRTYPTGDWIRSSPAIAGHALYVGSNDRKLYAFDLNAGPATGPWPMYRANARRTGRAIVEPLAIVVPPASLNALVGDPVDFTFTPSGTAPFSYQWRKNGAPIPGATAATLHFDAAAAADTGAYSVTVTNAQGSVTSAAATLSVYAAGLSQLSNLSVRTTAGSGSQTFIVGFVIAGASKPLLLRAIGPTLADYGVTGVLPDPQLAVYDSSTLVASNDNWGGTTALKQAFTELGAFTLPDASADAALLTTLDAKPYTVQITGGVGIALAEVYDAHLDPASAPRLTNISARTQVGTGNGILIAGFVVHGAGAKRVLIRGVGPRLLDYGVSGVLADPVLQLFKDGALVAENDDWGGAPALSAAAEAVGAFTLGQGGKDSALLVTLPAGVYTAQVSGVGGTTGVALVEIYDVQ
ncbi:S8 family serine peptidase [Horticoccus luteus]|uniref:S8 family serine peptidase n=1 Tax=Horticoccus luteus TaxID=2862869 RepID=A0A8F9XKC5_9BACT|nr:S8 family serine peptidase [Horticoccus luteus]QYM77934.1 S8 family serine peptidase [Horticoccus luteus]